VLEITYAEQLHRIISVLLDEKIASSSVGSERSTSPRQRHKAKSWVQTSKSPYVFFKSQRTIWIVS